MNQAQKEGFPTDVEHKEMFFMNEVGEGEALCQDSMFDFKPSYSTMLVNVMC